MTRLFIFVRRRISFCRFSMISETCLASWYLVRSEENCLTFGFTLRTFFVCMAVSLMHFHSLNHYTNILFPTNQTWPVILAKARNKGGEKLEEKAKLNYNRGRPTEMAIEHTDSNQILSQRQHTAVWEREIKT